MASSLEGDSQPSTVNAIAQLFGIGFSGVLKETAIALVD